MTDKLLKRHIFIFNPKENGGEQLMLCTNFVDNGDPGSSGIFTNQALTLQSYCNDATFNLLGASLTPENLRRLANELETCLNEAIAIKAAE